MSEDAFRLANRRAEPDHRLTRRRSAVVRPGDGIGDADDGTLMQRLCRGDTAAFAVLYDRYAPHVHGLTCAVLHDDCLAEEATHDVFLGLWRHPQAFEAARGAFGGWLLRIARNRAVDLVRRRREQPFPPTTGFEDGSALESPSWLVDPDPDPADQAIALLAGREVRSALTRLTPDHRRLLELAYFGGLTQREIAVQLDRPLGTVKTQIRTAMQRLADLLDDWNPACADDVGERRR